jgi:hypothetical protein
MEKKRALAGPKSDAQLARFAYQCRHSWNDEARRVDIPLELRLRLMGQSARKVIGENARYGSLEAVLAAAPPWIEKMWQ